MEKQRWKIGTLGVSAHDELVLKSMLHLVAGRTQATWEFSDDMDADVLLCDSSSALAAIAMRRSADGAGPTCVAFARLGQPPSTFARVLHAPLRALELVTLLDDIAQTSRRAAAPPPGSAGERLFADVLRALCTDADPTPRAYRIATHAGTLVVALPERTFVAEVDDGGRVGRLASYRGPVHVDALDAVDAAGLRAAPRQSLEPLLWQCGLAAPVERRFASGAASRWRLRRWPDFGRTSPRQEHLALAAALGARPASADELAARARVDIDAVRAFLNACAFCDLLDVAADAPAKPRAERRGWTDVVRQLRSALGLAAS